MARPYVFTSESVTEGHPDKIADQISDVVLDAILSEDPIARVACEVMVATGLVFVSGEISTRCYVEIPKLVRRLVEEIGYTDSAYGMDYQTCAILTAIDEQSPDIALGVVDKGGAGDQGMMVGYACKETEELMPCPIMLAHRMARRLADARRQGLVDYLRPDGKTQVSVVYEDGVPVGIDTVVIAAQHHPGVSHARIEEDMIEKVALPVLPEELVKGRDVKYHINPTGRFEKGGPQADVGLTGRKVVVDTYGASAAHGGGCFSGKDPTKVDRSGAYAARYVAKNVVAADLADRCVIQLAYAIGISEPVSVYVDTLGTGRIPDTEIEDLVCKHFDLTPGGIIAHLKLRRPIYRATAAYGHFGREEDGFTWEKKDKAADLKRG